MSKLSPIPIEMWLEAEKEVKILGCEPQPAGSVTVEQYSEMIGRSVCRARFILGELAKKGFATSRPWKNGERGVSKVYFLKPKKDWPKR